MLYITPFTSFIFDGKIYDVYFEHERNDKKLKICNRTFAAANTSLTYRAITRCEIWDRNPSDIDQGCVGLGVAFCTWPDNFNPRLGRCIAFGRAIGTLDFALNKRDRKEIFKALKERKTYE